LGARRWIEVDVLCCILKPLLHSRTRQQNQPFNHIKALGVDGGHQIVYVLLGIHLVWNGVIHLFVPA
jgi:hypothetical protein